MKTAKQLRADPDFKRLAQLLGEIKDHTFFYTVLVVNQTEIFELSDALRKKGFSDELVKEELNNVHA